MRPLKGLVFYNFVQGDKDVGAGWPTGEIFQHGVDGKNAVYKPGQIFPLTPEIPQNTLFRHSGFKNNSESEYGLKGM